MTYIWLAERVKILAFFSKEIENNDCYVKHVFMYKNM